MSLGYINWIWAWNHYFHWADIRSNQTQVYQRDDLINHFHKREKKRENPKTCISRQLFRQNKDIVLTNMSLFYPDPKTRTGTDPKIQVRVRVRVHAKYLLGLFFGPAGLGSGPGPTRDPFGYPKYPQIIVYIWVIGYIFGILDFFFKFRVWIFGYNCRFLVKF